CARARGISHRFLPTLISPQRRERRMVDQEKRRKSARRISGCLARERSLARRICSRTSALVVEDMDG
ncbi:MAG: hypothetical protein ABIT38_17120, partial [Gemmatimonadaceae bacterium]